ncbi:unnamed protein product [Brassica oleracea]|uniref:Uncharacterized protein n=3 Tax=Brassica TaxID=3705 RepID=A0A0D3C4L3_BRAOL|nr:PREDICTED: UPF0481 protein At3g47200 [Brassica oleracea var. oleracea]KAG2285457.1 hypothetical protein Bca52824_045061 [Brassica carinata]VDD15180.1 unnamed protein product [Brassica oleracea]
MEQPANASVHDGGESLLKIRIESMHEKLKEPPRLLSSAAGKPTCSIFRVPQTMIDSNGRCYEPRVVSVGPYHRGKTQLKMMEEHKWRYLNALVTRTHPTKSLTLEDYMKTVKSVEELARESYSESIHMKSDEFNEMMVLDGCFILELFRKVSHVVPFQQDDPLVNMAWVLPFFTRDFLRLENQIPFFVLEALYDLTRSDNERESNVSLQSLAFAFFTNTMDRPEQDLARFKDLEAKHLLDLVRSSLIPDSKPQAKPTTKPEKKEKTPSNIIHSISKLRQAGIKIRELKDEESFLVVRFRHGAIEMPRIIVDDFMGSFFPNCVAYEQCHAACSKHFTTYATLLDCLMNINKDVGYLCEQKIIENYFGTESAVAGFVNSLGRDVAFDLENCYLKELFIEVNEYYDSSWNVRIADLKNTYFSSPWSFISALAALILLILSIVQTIFTVYPR